MERTDPHHAAPCSDPTLAAPPSQGGDSTVVSLLTAPGTSALATVGVLGPQAWAMVQPLFKPRGQQPRLGQEVRHWLGRFAEAGIGDEVVLTLTGTPARQRAELHCHGGRTILRWIVDRLVTQGAVEIPWPDWLWRTASHRLHGAIAQALSQAPTLRTANLLLEQMHGMLERKLNAILQATPAAALAMVEELLTWADVGLHLTTPWRVVVAGAPNAGKSSLVNALLGYQRAITAAVPGTTRDVLTARTAFDGWPVELVDTAGQRDAQNPLEAQGIARAAAAALEADLVLWLADLTAPVLPPEDWQPRRLLLVGNKADQRTTMPPWATLVVSALTGQGVPELMRHLVSWLIPQIPSAGTALPCTPELVRDLKAAREMFLQGNGQAVEVLAAWLMPCLKEQS